VNKYHVALYHATHFNNFCNLK